MSISKHGQNSSQEVVSEYFKNNVMDESSDFHEKKNFKNLKSLPKNNKKKAAKKIKGQKDIRTALKPKKSELINYSKKFDQVCKNSGIDIDSEQLQLAIALSKSLNPSDTNEQEDLSPSCTTECSKNNNNSNKIRTTLQEYGFTVPNIKIEKNLNKKTKKNRKPYKLLTTSENERKQMILDRYALIISQTKSSEEITIETNHKCLHNKLVHLATNASYDCIKDIAIFYTKDLLEFSPNSIGSLLKDWATIPGRPVSPLPGCVPNFKLEDLNFTQCELDIILSGTVDNAKSLIKSIAKDFVSETNIEKGNTDSLMMEIKDKAVTNETLSVAHNERSGSPDIFEDEVSLILDKSSYKSREAIKDNYFMDLTECVSVYKKTDTINKTVLSQCSNTTKRKSSDMDITNCIASSSQPIVIYNCPLMEKYYQEQKSQEVIDSNIKENIDLTQDVSFDEVNKDKYKKLSEDKVDLTQSSDSCELPDVYLSLVQKADHEETIILEANKYTGMHARKCASSNNSAELLSDLGPKDIMTVYSDAEEVLDLTSEIQKSPSINHEEENIIECNASFNKDENDSEIRIDLTQSSEASNNEIDNRHSNMDGKSPKVSYSSLGKCDNMSLDYDDVFHNSNSVLSMKENEIDEQQSNFDHVNASEENSATLSNRLDSSQTSEVFAIYDTELDYSVHQSRLEVPGTQFELGGLSILDNVSKYSIDHSKRESTELMNLPGVNGEERSSDSIKTKLINTTPLKDGSSEVKVTIETPKTDYIIKTDQVTPMLDYTSLDTPGRNKELDKYGLKPFKRKRAIQLLTHLYNQTHPLVENVSKEDIPSASKKLKVASPSKKSPRKYSKSPKKKSPKIQESKDYISGNLYEVTNEIPAIRVLECASEDYVFQKREKAKVHSCIVPLHIAFHNYVSCRNGLREAILRYEPINIDDVHKHLVADGYRYDPKDLLKFLDKKCITVKTADNSKNR